MGRIVWLVFIFVCLGMSPAWACDCEPAPPEQAQAEADLIFIGTVIGSNTNWISGGMKYTFLVNSTWKQGADSILIVNTDWESDCGVAFREGLEYLVYGQKKFTLKTNQCLGTKLLTEAEADLQLLGPGNAPRPSYWVPIMQWGVGILGALSLLILAWIVLRRRNRPISA